MSIGNGWPQLGSMTKEDSFKLLDAYWDAGGNYMCVSERNQDWKLMTVIPPIATRRRRVRSGSVNGSRRGVRQVHY
jgi:hypothetical protein